MELSPMRYKDYVWPHNPRTYAIHYQRLLGNHKVPFGRYHLQDLGLTRRVMKGEGEFVGEDAYKEFGKLATVFYDKGPGILIHPVWQTSNAYFVELSLNQEPRRDYVRYTFTFWESFDSYEARAKKAVTAGSGTATQGKGAAGDTGVWHRVVKGECLWKIARDYGVELGQVVELNPGIKNPNLILPGELVRVK